MRLLSLTPDDFKAFAADGARFEALVCHLLQALGYRILEKPAIGPDGGRDVLVERKLSDSMGERTEKVVVQCKHSLRKAVKEKDVGIWQNAITRYKARGYLLVTDSRVTENLSQAFRGYTDDDANSPRWATFWDVDDLIRHLNDFPDICSLFFGRRYLTSDSIDPLAAAQSRLRLYADSQIEQFARGKYIPKLYVTRGLQQQVVRFTATESKIAEANRLACLSSCKNLIQHLTDHLLHFDHRTTGLKNAIDELTKNLKAMNSEIQELTKLITRLKDYGREKERKDAEVSRLRNVKEKKNELLKQRKAIKAEVDGRIHRRIADKKPIDELEQHLELCFEAADKLSTRTYFAARDQYDTYSDSLRSVLSLLASEYGETDRPSEVSGLGIGLPTSSNDRVLIDGGFLYELRNLINSELESVVKLFRNTLVIIDRAGSGKTNMICHLVDSLATEGPIILLFGKDQFAEDESIIKSIIAAVSKALGRSDDSMQVLDHLLEKAGKFLIVFIDGINENRRISKFDVAISRCLEWAQTHRIKFVFTCRDIYWDFFTSDVWGHHVHRILKEELNQFSRSEYGSALPLYLDHYQIKCELAGPAKEACHHPLLLRFFCEAYGSVGGPEVNLGEVSDIRLKELFDVYVHRKAEQIRRALNDRNSDRVLRYLFQLVSFMFQNVTTKVKTSEIEDATGDSNTSTEESLYLRLLDEDIIIEEQPGEDIDNRNISFVYEEFMEYLLARSIIKTPALFGIRGNTELFQMLDKKLPDWVNARGVAEYVALMLIQSDGQRTEAINFFNLMISHGKTWGEAFWSVIGKCPENRLDTDIYDLFSAAINSAKLPTVKHALTLMARYSEAGCNKLAAVLLWSVALPQALTWDELTRLESLSDDELKALGDRLTERLANMNFSDPPGNLAFDSLLDTLLPFLGSEQRKGIELHIRRFGAPENRVSTRAFVRVFWKFFPEYYPMLVNGLFDNFGWTRSFCADKLQFTKYARKQVAYLCGRLAEVEHDQKVKSLLLYCSKVIQSEL